MTSRADAREGGNFSVSYIDQDNNALQHKFHTQDQADGFAIAIKLMGMTEIFKYRRLNGVWVYYNA